MNNITTKHKRMSRTLSLPTRVIVTQWGVKTIGEYKDGSIYCYCCGKHVLKKDVIRHNKEMCVP